MLTMPAAAPPFVPARRRARRLGAPAQHSPMTGRGGADRAKALLLAADGVKYKLAHCAE
jgi:hypothetical protein